MEGSIKVEWRNCREIREGERVPRLRRCQRLQNGLRRESDFQRVLLFPFDLAKRKIETQNKTENRVRFHSKLKVGCEIVFVFVSSAKSCSCSCSETSPAVTDGDDSSGKLGARSWDDSSKHSADEKNLGILG